MVSLICGLDHAGYSGATAGRWIITFGIGLSIGIVAFAMGLGIELITEAKLERIAKDVERYGEHQPHMVLLRFVGYNLALVRRLPVIATLRTHAHTPPPPPPRPPPGFNRWF